MKAMCLTLKNKKWFNNILFKYINIFIKYW